MRYPTENATYQVERFDSPNGDHTPFYAISINGIIYSETPIAPIPVIPNEAAILRYA